MWTLAEAVERAGGTLIGPDTAFESVGTDSRADCSGQLFIALRGDNFDGHAYVAAARAAGAVAAVVDHPLPLDLPQWVVDDTRLALGRLAAAWRDRIPGRLIAITGSNGKTTVKEMIAAILAQVGRVRATQGNLNNDIGMPLTLLRARDEDFLVLEMGANHPGEIGYMTDLARPEVALITNAGRAHLEGFGSVEGVARAKGEIARGLPAGGVFVTSGDSPHAGLWDALAEGRQRLTFALDGPADVTSEAASIRVSWDEDGFRTEFTARLGAIEMPLTLRLAGHHNVRNALAAAAGAMAMGVEATAIRDGLASLRPVKGRLCPRHCRGVGLIDDTYNANPDSIAAAIEVLAGLAGRRWLVLGDLGELGPEAPRLHEEIGARARATGLDRLATVGTLSAGASRAFGAGAAHFPDQASLVASLLAELGARDRVLVKGSRLARMEVVVEALCAEVKS
ncbi:UDP-N-acetylmuramoyl-tripeptide--D-alanyl-D-alanine ligase [Thiocystis violacea]|uniref:UDP-N-acetylmuramoyl-tripeptide--D-alanyl-D- alanine ligase n=1 Tax=Thiocystis violacea TaxID=13725 RepID=UPI0019074C35|nr:UDP-N-acetylmuramoyl-tripeptide--D-alanyl-D-alanine ligase [Thiocystis violacea]MBK1716474.1 UDP-N-acetylmuramoylalanyl-D-glutamate--2,6-diaminopimelate ligase [Thiocystis violacea]